MTDDFKQLKKNVTESWRNAFPQLTAFTPNKLYKIVGPVIIGLELIRLPFAEEYRPHFVLYPLWSADIQACLEHPLILSEFYNKKRLQFSVPYNKHAAYFPEMLESIKNQRPLLFQEEISLRQLLLLFDDYSDTFPLKAAPNSYLQARVQEVKLETAIYYGNSAVVKELLNQIQKRKWDAHHFKQFGIDVNTWLQSLHVKAGKPGEVIALVEANTKHKKVSKLQRTMAT